MILKYAGPLGDFYAGTEYVVKKCWLQFAGFESTSKINIMDIEGRCYLFDEKDEYLSMNAIDQKHANE